jgi:hypothetical protein
MIANIASDDALILPHHANPAGLNFRERQAVGRIATWQTRDQHQLFDGFTLSAGEQFQHPAPNIPAFKVTAQTACAVLFGPVALFGPCLPLPLSAGATCSQYQLSWCRSPPELQE